jgi:hypothetical protein
LSASGVHRAQTEAAEFPMHRRAGIALSIATVFLGGAAAPAELPPPDRSTIIAGQAENESLSATDRYYTSGVRFGITLPTGELPGFAGDLGHALCGEGQQRLSFDLPQNMFTLGVTRLRNPIHVIALCGDSARHHLAGAR